MNRVEPSDCSSNFTPVGNGVGEGVSVCVAVGLGVKVGLGVNVIVAVGVSVAKRPGIPEAPEQERITRARAATKIVICGRAFRCFIFSPERSVLFEF